MACGCKERRAEKAAAREARLLEKQQAAQAAQQASLTASAQK